VILSSGMLLPPLWLAWREPTHRPRWWILAGAAAATLGACLLVLMWHNYARFGNPFEQGQRYQLSMAYEGKMQHFSLRYFAHNLYVYYFRPPAWTTQFPLVSAPVSWSSIPGYFAGEEVAGLGCTLPFLGLALAAPLAGRRHPSEVRTRIRLLLLAVAATYAGSAFVLLIFFSSTERYMADFTQPLALLALFGALGIERWAQSQRTTIRRIVNLLLWGIGSYTVVLGVLISFDYNARVFVRDSPVAAARIQRVYHNLAEGIMRPFSGYPGPRRFSVTFRDQPRGTVTDLWHTSSERVVIEHLGPGLIRFGYRPVHGFGRWSREQRFVPGRASSLVLQLPSF
jgi:hypothetical protein